MNYTNNNGEELNNSSTDHWEKYKVYYLVFGSLFLTIMLILASNISLNRKINLLLGNEEYSSSGFGSQSKLNNYSSRLKNEPFPDYVKERIEREIKKIQKSSGGQTKENREEYVEQVMSFPWHQVSPENNNLNEVKQTLEKSHYGMKKVKEAIIEYLAGKKQAGKNLGKVLCLVGSPGTGKTSIARSIAEALGRPFNKVSLGGVHDEGEIRGHRNTYISAKPGIIVQALQRAKVKNPVIVADEIEKMGKSEHNGDPAAAFLEILDPEQNEKFRDHYIELPIDLSQIMFICTANRIDTISKPLRDRMEIIEIPPYTEDEKLHIAKEHLIPKLFNRYNKLTREQLALEDSAIKEIIKNYTLEPGVRNLERNLEKIFEKFSEKKEIEGKETENITLTNIQEYLGKPTVPDLSSEVDYKKPGVVNGLSVSEIGGSVLPILASFSKIGGKIIITGNLERTMKESVEVAITFAKDYITTFKIKDGDGDDFDFEKISIHIDVPKAGIPKDGPSAGVAFVTAIISALTGKKIPQDIGMTGTINIHGGVDKIGGLQEKIYAAHQKGIKKVFIPKKNYDEDWKDIPSKIRNDFEVISVKDYKKIYDDLFK